jgi:prepilin-type N-terminal cleavage/methylation domain-containing protein
MMKNKNSPLGFTSGFTIVELMVVLVIISLVSVSFAAYLYQQSNLTAANQYKQNFSSLQNTVLNCASSSNCIQQSENLNK